MLYENNTKQELKQAWGGLAPEKEAGILSVIEDRTRIVGEIEDLGCLGSHKLARTPVDLLDVVGSLHYNSYCTTEGGQWLSIFGLTNGKTKPTTGWLKAIGKATKWFRGA